MSYIFRCKWCGREYDNRKSTASDYATYCSGKCEAEAKRSQMEAQRAKMEAERMEMESRRAKAEMRRAKAAAGNDENLTPWEMFKLALIGIAIVMIVVGMCTDDNDEKEKKQDKTEQRTKPATEQEESTTQATPTGKTAHFLIG